jgi:hypothetical protein
MVKVLIRWEELTNVNIYAPSTLAPTDISQILLGLKRKRDFNTKKVEDNSSPLSWMDKSSEKINKKSELYYTVEQIDLIYIH